MSLTRQFFRDMRPFFRMFDEPMRTPTYMGFPQMRSMLDDPFFRYPNSLRPAVDVSEEGNDYVVEAELPGVKKENVQVRIGDGGRSVTIEGKVVERSAGAAQPEAQPAQAAAETDAATPAPVEGSKEVAPTAQSNQISSERQFVGSTSFTRTVWLPRRADPERVSAKLNDGVLTVTIPKATDPGSFEVRVD
ncbi:hypothetical protein EIP86_008674 [Pleurotus ostreatoroseus]|nr:hypothetical protein EIP86_008674 [Pleurotus ostreatoroseus]